MVMSADVKVVGKTPRLSSSLHSCSTNCEVNVEIHAK